MKGSAGQSIRRVTRSLSFKLSFYAGLIVFFAVVAFAYRSISAQERILVGEKIQDSIRRSQLIKPAIREGMAAKDPMLIGKALRDVESREGFREINIYDVSGTLHYTSREGQDPGSAAKLPTEKPLPGKISSNAVIRHRFTDNGNLVNIVMPLRNEAGCSSASCHVHAPSDAILGTLEVKVPLHRLRGIIREQTRSTIAFAFLLFIVIAGAIGLAVIYVVIPPIERLKSNARKIARGNYGPFLEMTERSDEIGELAQVFEKMSVKIRERTMQLEKSRKMYEELFNEVPCYLTVINRDYCIVSANRAFRDEFGDQVGKFCYEGFKGCDSICDNCQVRKTFADGMSHSSEEVWSLGSGGAKVHAVVHTVPIFGPDGEISHALEMSVEKFTNVTELKLLRNELTMLGETIAGTCHSIKNILSGLEGGVYILDSGLKKGNEERIRGGWEIVRKNVDKVSDLVKDILYASKERVPECRECDPGGILDHICTLYDETARGQGIGLKRDFPVPMGTCSLDSKGIHSAVCNLLSNAIAACIAAEDRTDHHIVVSGAIEDEILTIRVMDSGAGMPEEVKQNLSKKFYSTKGSGGTGLGFLVTRKVVQEHGGTISVESIVGRGTSFIIRIPLSPRSLQTA